MIDIEARERRAEELFLQGYNCAQAVAGALCDLYDVPLRDVLCMSAAFGGGMGRMRLTCGAVTGMSIVTGYENGQTEPNDPEQKLTNYRLVQDLAHSFEAEHGSLTCSELLAMRAAKQAATIESAPEAPVDNSTNPTPAPRNEAYYHQRPCLVQIRSAVRIYCRKWEQLHPES